MNLIIVVLLLILDKGEIEIYVEKTIVEEVDDDHFDITLERAVELRTRP